MEEKANAFKQTISGIELKVAKISKSATGEDLYHLVTMDNCLDVNDGLRNVIMETKPEGVRLINCFFPLFLFSYPVLQNLNTEVCSFVLTLVHTSKFQVRSKY